MSVKSEALIIRRGTYVATPALALAALMAVLDGTAVTASLDVLRISLGSSTSVIVWVTSIYLISASLALPLVGWASARFGGRRLVLAGLGLFVLGSVASGLAGSVEVLIAARVMQGFGGGLLEPAALALTAQLAPREQVGKVMGLMSLVINLGPVLGPLAGGLLADAGLWRWIFLGNVPLGLVVAAVVFRVVPADDEGDHSVRADVRGMLLLSPGFAMLLLSINRWGESGQLSAASLLAMSGGAVLLGAYVRHALGAVRAPVLDLRLMRIRPYAAALAVMSGVGVTMYGQLTGLPAFAARVHHLDGLARGSLVAALGVGLLASMTIASRISDGTGPRVLVRTGGLVAAPMLALFALGSGSWPVWLLAIVLFVEGLGFGAVAAPTFASVYRTLSPEDAAQGTTGLFITVQLAASLGVTVVGLLADRAGAHQTSLLFLLLAGVVLLMSALGGLLPGRPAMQNG